MNTNNQCVLIDTLVDDNIHARLDDDNNSRCATNDASKSVRCSSQSCLQDEKCVLLSRFLYIAKEMNTNACLKATDSTANGVLDCYKS